MRWWSICGEVYVVKYMWWRNIRGDVKIMMAQLMRWCNTWCDVKIWWCNNERDDATNVIMQYEYNGDVNE